MATIRTDTKRVTDISSEFVGVSKDIAAYSAVITGVIGKLAAEVKSRGNIDAQLKDMQTLIEGYAKSTQQAALTVSKGMEEFQRAEERNKESIASASSSGGSSGKKTTIDPVNGGKETLSHIKIDNVKTTNYGTGGSGNADMMQKGIIAGIGFTASKAAGKGIQWVAEKTGINGGSGSGSSEYKTSTYSTGDKFDNEYGSGEYSVNIGNLEAKAGADYVFDPAKGNIAASASAKASVSLLNAKARIEGKYGSAEVGAEVGTATASADARIGLMKDGNFNPSISAKVAAETSAIKGTASAEAHDDSGYSAGVKAEGHVATAQANASINMDASKGEFSAKAGALVAATSGSATVKGNIGPIKGGVTVTGYAGGAGAKAEASFKDGTLKIGAGAAVGVGGGIEFEVGLGNWADKVDKATNGAVGDAVSAVGSGINAALTPVSAALGAATSVYNSGKDFVNAAKSGDVGGMITSVIKAPINAVKAVGNAVVSGAKAVVSGVASAAKSVFKFLTSW